MNASLSDHFFAKFRRGSQECKDAQRAFAESMAAYSLVCYFLQIKVICMKPPLCVPTLDQNSNSCWAVCAALRGAEST